MGLPGQVLPQAIGIERDLALEKRSTKPTTMITLPMAEIPH
jgi:hypothetical protein